MVVRVPCRLGELTVTVTPGSGFPSVVTVPVSVAVVCANALIDTSSMARQSRFLGRNCMLGLLLMVWERLHHVAEWVCVSLGFLEDSGATRSEGPQSDRDA